MVPKHLCTRPRLLLGFRAVLFRMVPKPDQLIVLPARCFRAVLFRMVPKRLMTELNIETVLELCCFEWFQNKLSFGKTAFEVLELCCFEWFQNDVFTLFFSCSFRAVLFRMVPKQTLPKTLKQKGFRAVLFRMVPKHLHWVFLLLIWF